MCFQTGFLSQKFLRVSTFPFFNSILGRSSQLLVPDCLLNSFLTLCGVATFPLKFSSPLVVQMVVLVLLCRFCGVEHAFPCDCGPGKCPLVCGRGWINRDISSELLSFQLSMATSPVRF